MCCWLLLPLMAQKNKMVHISESEGEKLFQPAAKRDGEPASHPPRHASFRWPTKWCISLSLKGKSSSSLLPKGTGSLQVTHPDMRLSDGPISTQVTSPKRKDSFGSGAFSMFFYEK